MTDQHQKDQFAELRKLGCSAGNGKLGEELGWRETAYSEVKDALLKDWGGSAPGSLTLSPLTTIVAN